MRLNNQLSLSWNMHVVAFRQTVIFPLTTHLHKLMVSLDVFRGFVPHQLLREIAVNSP